MWLRAGPDLAAFRRIGRIKTRGPVPTSVKYGHSHAFAKEVNDMKKLSVRRLETVKTTAALYASGCGVSWEDLMHILGY